MLTRAAACKSLSICLNFVMPASRYVTRAGGTGIGTRKSRKYNLLLPRRRVVPITAVDSARRLSRSSSAAPMKESPPTISASSKTRPRNQKLDLVAHSDIAAISAVALDHNPMLKLPAVQSRATRAIRLVQAARPIRDAARSARALMTMKLRPPWRREFDKRRFVGVGDNMNAAERDAVSKRVVDRQPIDAKISACNDRPRVQVKRVRDDAVIAFEVELARHDRFAAPPYAILGPRVPVLPCPCQQIARLSSTRWALVTKRCARAGDHDRALAIGEAALGCCKHLARANHVSIDKGNALARPCRSQRVPVRRAHNAIRRVEFLRQTDVGREPLQRQIHPQRIVGVNQETNVANAAD